MLNISAFLSTAKRSPCFSCSSPVSADYRERSTVLLMISSCTSLHSSTKKAL